MRQNGETLEFGKCLRLGITKSRSLSIFACHCVTINGRSIGYRIDCETKSYDIKSTIGELTLFHQKPREMNPFPFISASLLLLARVYGTSDGFVRIDRVYDRGDTSCTGRPLFVGLSPYPFNTRAKNFECVDYRTQMPLSKSTRSSVMKPGFYGDAHYKSGLRASLPPLVPSGIYLITYSYDGFETCSGRPLSIRALIIGGKCVQETWSSYYRVRCDKAKKCSIVYYSDSDCKDLVEDSSVSFQTGGCSGSNFHEIVQADKNGIVNIKNVEFSPTSTVEEIVAIKNGIRVYDERTFYGGRDHITGVQDMVFNGTYLKSYRHYQIFPKSEQDYLKQLETSLDPRAGPGYMISKFGGYGCPPGLTAWTFSFALIDGHSFEDYRVEVDSGKLVVLENDDEIYRGKLCECINGEDGYSFKLKSVNTKNECKLVI